MKSGPDWAVGGRGVEGSVCGSARAMLACCGAEGNREGASKVRCAALSIRQTADAKPWRAILTPPGDESVFLVGRRPGSNSTLQHAIPDSDRTSVR